LLILSLLGIDNWYLAVDSFELMLKLDLLASTVVASGNHGVANTINAGIGLVPQSTAV
jgi:hypothetical protein